MKVVFIGTPDALHNFAAQHCHSFTAAGLDAKTWVLKVEHPLVSHVAAKMCSHPHTAGFPTALRDTVSPKLAKLLAHHGVKEHHTHAEVLDLLSAKRGDDHHLLDSSLPI